MAKVRQQNIVGRWCPSAGATGFRLLDRSGRGNHGALTNMDAASDWVVSGGKGALDFDGSNDYVGTANNTIHETLLTQIGISFWMKLNTTGVQSAAFGSLDDSNLSRISAHCPWSDNVIYWDFGGFSSPSRLSTSALTWSTSAWYHIGLTAGPQGMGIWRDGVLLASTTTANPGRTAFASPFTIGRGNLNGTIYTFPGQIDDFIIFNTAPTSNEVTEIYRRGRGYGIGASPHRSRRSAASTNRRRRLICGSVC